MVEPAEKYQTLRISKKLRDTQIGVTQRRAQIAYNIKSGADRVTSREAQIRVG